MSKVIVTGANGFLGSWLTKKLVEEGHSVYAMVRKSSDLSELNECNCQIVYGDVTDLSSLQIAFSGMDYVFHVAAYIAYSSAEREKMININVHGTAHVLKACKEHNIKRLIYISSVVAIGSSFSSREILSESSDYNVSDLNLGYFETKRQAEDLVKNSDLDFVILNPSTIYGEGDAKKGSRKVQIKVAQGKFPFYTSGGVNVVDIEDVVNGIILAWHKGRRGERYILASENILIKDLFKMIAHAAGVQPPRYYLPRWILFILGGLGDFLNLLGIKSSFSLEKVWTSTLYHWYSNEKAKKELGFQCRPAKESIEKSVLWMKKNKLI